jgi:group I intron endonuclease
MNETIQLPNDIKFYVYYFMNKVNGKVYVGKTQNIKKRLGEHQRADGDCPYFHRAVKKYGIDNFKFDIIEEYKSEDDAIKMEIHYIDQYQSNIREHGYNLTIGGDGTSGYKHSPETIAKFSKSLKGKKSWNEGQKSSDETKLKSSISHMGQPGYWEGKELSEETKKKKSDAMKGKTWKLIDGKRVWFAKGDKNE